MDELLLYNGTIHTIDPRLPSAQAVLATDGIITFGNPQDDTRSSHVVGVAGYEELYLMKIPIELYEEMMKEVTRISKKRDGDVEPATMEKLDRMGGKPFKSSESDRSHKWR